MHKGKEKIIGEIFRDERDNITHITTQSELLFGISEEKTIPIHEIDAVLIWRVAYCITAKIEKENKDKNIETLPPIPSPTFVKSHL